MTDRKHTTRERLAEAMQIRRMTQADIVRAAQPYCESRGLKLNKSDVSQFVSGKVIPSQWKISILADALNVNEAWLMGYDVPIDRVYSGTEKVPGASPELDAYLIQQLSSLSPERFQLVLDILSLSESQARRVIDFLAGLKATEQP